jgi:hypothetical protein
LFVNFTRESHCVHRKEHEFAKRTLRVLGIIKKNYHVQFFGTKHDKIVWNAKNVKPFRAIRQQVCVAIGGE